MGTRKELIAAYRAKGGIYTLSTKNADMVKLIEEEAGVPPEGTGIPPVEQPVVPVAPVTTLEGQNSQLMDILLSITADIKNLKTDWQEFQKAYPRNTEVFSIGKVSVEAQPMEVKQENGSTFLTQVPVDLLKAAKDILGEKFTFECDALKDRPAFMFTVIVPKEYSTSDVEDKRSRVIDNALGANGVREWCTLVKANVIKTLGISIKV